MKLAIQQAKKASYHFAQVEDEVRNQILHTLSSKIQDQSHLILEENAKDLAGFSETHPAYDRLKLTEDRLKGIAKDLVTLANLPSPLNRILSEHTLPNGLQLQKNMVYQR